MLNLKKLPAIWILIVLYINSHAQQPITVNLYKTVYAIDTCHDKLEVKFRSIPSHLDDKKQDTFNYKNNLAQKLNITSYYGEDLQAGKISFDSPEVSKKYNGNGTMPYTPTDNSIASSNDNSLISCINSSLYVFDTSGKKLLEKNFSSIINDPSLVGHYFYDPRIIYDNQSKRYIICLLYGNKSNNNHLVLLTSATINSYNSWNIYKIKISNTWAQNWLDYPSLSVNNHEIFISGNLFNDNDNFNQSIIFQIDKNSAYSGQNLQIHQYENLTGQPFNLVPVTHQNSYTYHKNMYFLSNQPSGGNKLFIYKIKTPFINSTVENETITIPQYNPPTDALQKGTQVVLDQGRCRIKNAYWQNKIIHTVFAAKDINGFGKIYYIRLDAENLYFQSQTFGLGGVDYAYPTVCPFSNDTLKQTSLITFLASGKDRYPEARAVICDEDFVFSNSSLLRKGDNFITTGAVKNNVDRWGDYTGNIMILRNGQVSVWSAAAFANSSNSFNTVITKIIRPSDTNSIYIPTTKLSIYPNPLYDIATIEFEASESNDYLLDLVSLDGKSIQEIWTTSAIRNTKYTLQFDKSPLSPGLYILVLRDKSGKVVVQQKFIVLAKEQ